jgi:histidine kinase
MKLLNDIRSNLNVKLFLSFLIVIVVGTIMLVAAVEVIMPRAFQEHLAVMGPYMVDEPEFQAEHEVDFFESFRSAVYKALIFAIPFALFSALIIGFSFSRQFVAPIKKMVSVSKKISEGNYKERIPIPKNVNIDEMDELKQLAISFNQMTLKLEKTEDLRRQLIGDVSHELRTPLSLIKASMEGLIDGLVPATNKTFYQVQLETDRLARLVDDLQALSIIESGAYVLSKQKSDIHEIVTSVLQNLTPQFVRKGIQLEDNFPKKKTLINIDVDRIKQVLTNILGNALKFTPKGGLVELTGEIRKDDIQISIKDSGIGISSEHLPYVFTRFYRVDKSWAESSGENEGTTISFTLLMN